jgi:Lrp/AsnC family transcriptional regulator for asnA, asnC and gidA
MNPLEQIDIEIIKDLLRDGRKNLIEIAQERGVSKDIVAQHYRKMKKSGILTGATIQYNYRLFGFEAAATILVNTDSQHLADVIERLKKISNSYGGREYCVFARHEYCSQFNIRIFTPLRNIEDLSKIKEKIKFRNEINGMLTYLWTDVINCPENLSLLSPNEIKKESVKKNPNFKRKILTIDEIDTKIVETLEKNGRIPFKNISESLEITVDTVSRRYHKLLQNGYIKVTAQINPRLIGYTAYIQILIALLSAEQIDIAVEKLLKIPDLSYLAKVSGGYDLLIGGLIKDFDHFFEFNNEILKIPNITRIETQITPVPTTWPGPGQYISTC